MLGTAVGSIGNSERFVTFTLPVTIKPHASLIESMRFHFETSYSPFIAVSNG